MIKFKPLKGQSVILIFLLLLMTIPLSQAQIPVYSSSDFQVYPNRVVQNRNEAQIISPTHIESNYQSPLNPFKPAEIVFKFSINGRDNEMPPGVDHQFTVALKDGHAETPLIEFGKKSTHLSGENSFMPTNARVRFRLDFRKQKSELDQNGFVVTYNGDKIFKQDFKGVFIAGAFKPLSWDFDNLASRKEMQLQDPDGDGIYELELVFNRQTDEASTASTWKLKNNISDYPKFISPIPISMAAYNMALDEMVTAIEPDKTFRTGKEWAGVWTRDISYSILLSMAILQPEVAKISLKRKVKNKKIIQDTGTGGAWPVSTDRMIWAVAAYEIYLVTGDLGWLKYAFEVVKNSAEADLSVAFNPATGLFKGESSFLDWREQTYPRWMQPADIFESECLGTNAVHFQAYMVLSKMAGILGETALKSRYEKVAADVKRGINEHLWVKEKNYYGQYRYGRGHKLLSSKSEALGEALCVWFGIAEGERAAQVIQNTPVNEFGIPCIFPQIPGIPPYHNQAIWPFVQSYWALAAAKAGSDEAVLHSFATIYRAAALFATNKENFVITNGDFAGTQVNSDNMLWSLSGSIGLVYKVLFGMQYLPSTLHFQPLVPKNLGGSLKLENFKYRNAVLDIEVKGFGNVISRFLMDGKILEKPEISAKLKGRHSLIIELSQDDSKRIPFSTRIEKLSPEYPKLYRRNHLLAWEPIVGCFYYNVYKDGQYLEWTSEPRYFVDTNQTASYQVVAVNPEKCESFASEPFIWKPAVDSVLFPAPANFQTTLLFQGNVSNKVVEISKSQNVKLLFQLPIAATGIYGLQFRYANGNGPMNTENKCALRQLYVDGKKVGTVVFPQRGNQEWSNWGFTNQLEQFLKEGKHEAELRFEPENENMHGEINQALIDYMEVVKIH